jgi:hypothetical protein
MTGSNHVRDRWGGGERPVIAPHGRKHIDAAATLVRTIFDQPAAEEVHLAHQPHRRRRQGASRFVLTH